MRDEGELNSRRKTVKMSETSRVLLPLLVECKTLTKYFVVPAGRRQGDRETTTVVTSVLYIYPDRRSNSWQHQHECRDLETGFAESELTPEMSWLLL